MRLQRFTSLLPLVTIGLLPACAEDTVSLGGTGDAGTAGAGTGGSSGGSGATGGASGSGGQAGAGGNSGSAGGAGCDGTQSTDEKFSKALQVLRDELKKGAVPGGAFAVVKDGKLVTLGVAGSKRAGVCDPITPDTLFRTVHATWPITTIAVLDAVEDKKLLLTDPITKFVPSLNVPNPSHGSVDQITLHHLLSSTSMYRQDVECGSLADSFANAKRPEIWAIPGSMHQLNATDFELAGLALETVDKKPFVDAVKERVLGPLSMGGAFDTATILKSDHSLGHDGTTEVQVTADCRNAEASTQYHGSIRDMAKLAEYLTGGAGQILDQTTVDAMLSKQGPSFWSPPDYAVYGFQGVNLEYDAVYEGSFFQGFSSVFMIYPQRRLAVITLLNVASDTTDKSAPVWTINDQVSRIYDPSIKPSPLPEDYKPDPASLPSLVANYKGALGVDETGERTLEVFLDLGKLAGKMSYPDGTSEPVSFAGDSADTFMLKRGPREDAVRFWRDNTGNAYAVSYHLGYGGPPLFRVP